MPHISVPVIKTRAMQEVEIRLGRSLEDELRDLYLDQGLRQEEVAERLGVDGGTVSRWMSAFGIVTRRTRRTEVA